MVTSNEQPTTGKLIWLLLALVVFFIYFFGLTVPLLGPDEPRYAQVAREMFLRGDWVTPTLGGFQWFEKPSLLYWLQITSYHLFGVSEFAARFGSALFGLGTIFSLWFLGRSAQNRLSENQTANDFAKWLALIAASSIGLLVFSRGASFDIILTFPITAALVAFFIAEQSEKKSGVTFYSLLFTFYFFTGLALLAKGLVGIVFPFAIVFFYHFLKFDFFPSRKFFISLLWGIPVILLVAALWYLPMYLTHGWKFIDEFFIQHHFQRYTSDKYKHPQPFWFFFMVLPLMTIPWLPFFLASVYKAVSSQWSAIREKNSARLSAHGAFALAWMTVPLVFFSLSGSKLPGYILPALPAALILTADYVWRFVNYKNSPRRKYALQILAFLTFAVVAVLLQFVVPKYAYADSTKGLIETANAEGYTAEKIVNLYTVSHNAEFYAAGRLIRETDGKLKRYGDLSVLLKDLESEPSRRILVLAPLHALKQITENDSVEAKVLNNNSETAIVFVKLK